MVRRSQNWTDDSPVAATAFTSCGSHAPPDKECNIPAESLDKTYTNQSMLTWDHGKQKEKKRKKRARLYILVAKSPQQTCSSNPSSTRKCFVHPC